VLKSLLTLALITTAPAAATAAPFQSAKTVDGAVFDPAGHVTVVHYWATWCVPCRVEMPMLDAYYRAHHAQGLAMLAVSIDNGASVGKIKAMTGPFAFPVARIDAVRMARRDIPSAIPATQVYDRSGRLVFETKADGHSTLDAATLDRVVTPLLARR
jgi:cytochrome c biogenesis protein CcmG/thiol:disulfide interchange protein DsbE